MSERKTIYVDDAIQAINVLYQEHRYKIPGKRETYSQYNEAWQDALSRAEGAIFNLPSAQSEIIRCKECKHWYDAPAIDEYNSCELDALIRHKDFYCANAERRTDDRERG